MTVALQPLLAEIASRPHEFDFFQALRRIDAASVAHPRLGQSDRPGQDPVRLGQTPSLAFAPRSVSGITDTKLLRDDPSDPPARLESFSFGLFGPNGALPLHLTELAFSRLHNYNDATLARFADMFHHRMASLFFRAWAESEPTVSHDRPDEDRFGAQIASLAGFGDDGLRDRDAMPDLAKLHFTGRLASHTRNAEGLQAILTAFFDVPAMIEEFIPNWVHLPSEAVCRLGSDIATGTLGSTLTAGAKIKVCHHCFRVVIGPMRFAAYTRLLPGGVSLAKLLAVTRNYVGDELEFEIDLILMREEVPSIRIGQAGRLGWTSWLGKPKPGDARDFRTTASSVASKPRRSGSNGDGDRHEPSSTYTHDKCGF